MTGQINLFSSVFPRDIQAEILGMVIREGNPSLLRVCKYWYRVIVGSSLNTLPIPVSALRTIWLNLKRSPPEGPIPLKHYMEAIEGLPESKPLLYNNFFKKLVKSIEQTYFTEVKFPFSETRYGQVQTGAIEARVQLDNSLIAIWEGIQDELNVSVPPRSTEEIRFWLNNPENKIELDRIKTLSLGSLGLEILPSEIGNLGSLKSLFLQDNQLKSLPDAIGNLGSLQLLALYCNQLKSLPDAIGNLSSLKTLNLQNNQLKSLPDTIGNLRVVGLNLQNNHLDSIPATLKDLSLLDTFHLDGNPLTFIPDNISKSSRNVFLKNKTIKQFKEELNFVISSPLAKLYQAIMRRTDLEETKRAFYRLSYEDQCLIFKKIFPLSGDLQTKDRQWGKHHLFDNMDIFYRSVRDAVISKYEGLNPEAKNTLEGEIYRLAGSPSTNDAEWGKNHALENLLRLADAVSKVALQVDFLRFQG
jgi:hypothetical protein